MIASVEAARVGHPVTALESFEARLPDFSWCNIPKRGKYTKNTSNGHQINLMARNRMAENIPTSSIPRHSTFTQIGTFGMKIWQPWFKTDYELNRRAGKGLLTCRNDSAGIHNGPEHQDSAC
jgi:hypothetical protein